MVPRREGWGQQLSRRPPQCGPNSKAEVGGFPWCPRGGVPERLAVRVGAFESGSLTSRPVASLDWPSVRLEVTGRAGWARAPPVASGLERSPPVTRCTSPGPGRATSGD